MLNFFRRKRKDRQRHVQPRLVAADDRHPDSFLEYEGVSAGILYRVAIRDKGDRLRWEFRLTHQKPKQLVFAAVVEDISQRVALGVAECLARAVDRYSPKKVSGAKESVWFWSKILATCLSHVSGE